jgi:origin recognition complex subunit 1
MSPQEFSRRYPKGVVPRRSKEFGKVFICRRGCNTRTATYTEEFIWEDIYNGDEDLPELIKLVQSQTKATRKTTGAGRPKAKDAHDLDDFVARDDDADDDRVPKTPSKRRKLEAASTPTSKHKRDLTPRKFLTPTHKRIFVKKPLEFTPLGTRILSPHALSSPYQLARNQLHVSSVPASLPCREEEFAEVYTQLEKAITDGAGSCIYIAGTPGTGKTATVREVVAQLNAAVSAEELDDFIFVEINGMKVTDPHQSYSLLWEALRGDRVSPTHALELLEREFSRPSPRRVPCVVLMDELDQLVTKNQSVMYNFFNWPQLRHSRLIVLAVANTMDLPERTLSNKISSRLGLHRITFKGYTHAQLIQIIESRLQNVPGHIVHPDAVQFASRKVAAVSGDARRALDICRRAVELAEAEALEKGQQDGPGTPSKKGRGKKAAEPPNRHIVTIATIKQAINEATSSPLQQYLRSLPLASKLLLAALLARVRRTGIAEALVAEVLDEARNLGLMSQLAPVHDILLLEGREEEADDLDAMGPTARKALVKAKGVGAAPRVVGMEGAVMGLAEGGIIGVESKRGERVRRVRLGVGDEEVRLALRDDDEVRGLGFNL